MAVLAARGSTWGGVVVGLVAAGIFVVFSAWVVAERVRASRKDSSGHVRQGSSHE